MEKICHDCYEGNNCCKCQAQRSDETPLWTDWYDRQMHAVCPACIRVPMGSRG